MGSVFVSKPYSSIDKSFFTPLLNCICFVWTNFLVPPSTESSLFPYILSLSSPIHNLSVLACLEVLPFEEYKQSYFEAFLDDSIDLKNIKFFYNIPISCIPSIDFLYTCLEEGLEDFFTEYFSCNETVSLYRNIFIPTVFLLREDVEVS